MVKNAVLRLSEGLSEAFSPLALRLYIRRPREVHESKRLTFVQFGDYAEGFWRLKNGGQENYYAQKHTVDFVGSLVQSDQIESVSVINFSKNSQEESLPNGVKSLGVELYPKDQISQHQSLIRAVQRSKPTHLFVNVPSIHLISWAIRKRILVLPMFADSFRAKSLKARLKYRMLALLLNNPAIQLVANHNVSASLDLVRIGVEANKVVPYDWPPLISPADYGPKQTPLLGQTFSLLYVGRLIETKGVGDAIRAVSLLSSRHFSCKLTIIGDGDFGAFKKLAAEVCLEDNVAFLGPKSHAFVLSAMRNHDAVLVPSQWSYPEGLPMTLYEALCTHTPLIISDHPMFAMKFRDRENAMVFPERNVSAFADCIQELALSPTLYSRLASNSFKAAKQFLHPLKYDRLISDFLNAKARASLRKYSMAESCTEQANLV